MKMACNEKRTATKSKLANLDVGGLKMEILYKDLSYWITGCVFDGFSEIGPGFDEYTYHQGLKTRFENESLPFQSKPHIKLYYCGMEIAQLEPDFIVDDAIVLELKAIQTEFLPENYAQIISYLRATSRLLGVEPCQNSPCGWFCVLKKCLRKPRFYRIFLLRFSFRCKIQVVTSLLAANGQRPTAKIV